MEDGILERAQHDLDMQRADASHELNAIIDKNIQDSGVAGVFFKVTAEGILKGWIIRGGLPPLAYEKAVDTLCERLKNFLLNGSITS